MTTIADVRDALKDAVASTGLRCSPYVMDTITPPCVQIMRGEYDPRYVFSGLKCTYTFSVRVFASRAAEAVSAKLLDQCGEPAGERSLIAAIQNADNWPDDLVDYAQVVNVSAEQVVVIAEVPYLTVELEVEVVW